MAMGHGGGDMRGLAERDDDRPATYEDRGPSRVTGVIVALAILALVAIVVSFMLTQPRSNDLPASALSGAAATVAGTVDRATQETARQPTR